MTPSALPPLVRKMRRVMELVAALHRLGYQRLRLTCQVALGIAPAPIWLGDIVPVTCTRRDHGALLIDADRTPRGNRFLPEGTPHGPPTFSSRRMPIPDYPWPHFLEQTPEECARTWVSAYPALAEEGHGMDKPYADWFATALTATEPGGILVARYDWGLALDHVRVDYGPSEVDSVPLPPPGEG